MRSAVIDGTAVINIIEAEPGFELPGKLVVPSTNASPGWSYQDGSFSPPEPPTPTAADVDAERDRRIASGFIFEGKLYQSRAEDQKRIAGAALAALKAMMNGKGEGEFDWFPGVDVFAWIADDNSTTAMDAPTTFAFGEVAAGHEQAHIFAARALKDADPIPADYADAAYWP